MYAQYLLENQLDLSPSINILAVPINKDVYISVKIQKKKKEYQNMTKMKCLP